MTRKIAAVDPQSLQDVLKQTHGDALSRMQQAAAILIRQGVEPAGMEALLQRIRALSELLGEHPGRLLFCEGINRRRSTLRIDRTADEPR